MSVYVQLIIYLVIFVGMIITMITFLDKQAINKDYYTIDKQAKNNIEVWLVTKDISKAKVDMLKVIIEKGDYASIYDITNSFFVKDKDIDM